MDIMKLISMFDLNILILLTLCVLLLIVCNVIVITVAISNTSAIVLVINDRSHSVNSDNITICS